jgi:hypothetical protein
LPFLAEIVEVSEGAPILSENKAIGEEHFFEELAGFVRFKCYSFALARRVPENPVILARAWIFRCVG